MNRIGLVVGALLLTVLAYMVGAEVVKCICLQSASDHWPTVVGQITESQVQTVPEQTPGGFRFSSWPDLSYRYTVEGKTRIGQRLRLLPEAVWDATEPLATENKALADSVVASYRSGSAVTVHYQPGAPDVAVLLPGRSALDGLWLLQTVPLAALALAAWAAVWFGRPASKSVAGMRLESRAGKTRLVRGRVHPIVLALLALAPLSTAVLLATGSALRQGGLNPLEVPPFGVATVWVALVAASALFGIYRARHNARRNSDIVLDGQTLTFATPTAGRLAIPIRDMAGCEAVQVPLDGKPRFATRIYWMEGGEVRGADLFCHSQRTRPAELAIWLAQWTGLEIKQEVTAAIHILGAVISAPTNHDPTLISGRFKTLLAGLSLLGLGFVVRQENARLAPEQAAAAAYDQAPRSSSGRRDERQTGPGTVLQLNPFSSNEMTVGVALASGPRVGGSFLRNDVASLRVGDTVTAELYQGRVTEVQVAGRTAAATDSPMSIYQYDKDEATSACAKTALISGLLCAWAGGTWWWSGVRRRALRAVARKSGWRYQETIADFSEAETLPHHFTVQDVIVSPQPGAILRPGPPRLLACDVRGTAKYSGTTFFVPLEKDLSRFRVSPGPNTHTVIGVERPAVHTWLQAHSDARWDVTAWNGWLICSHPSRVGGGHMATTMDQVQALADALERQGEQGEGA